LLHIKHTHVWESFLMLFYHSGHWTFGVICTTKDCEKIFEFGNIMPKIPQSFFWWIQCIVVEDM